jgi:hypothetical protein
MASSSATSGRIIGATAQPRGGHGTALDKLRNANMTVGWKPETLSEIAGQDEIRIGSGRMGGGYNRWTPIWVVRIGDDLYVRSGLGANGLWYRHATQSQAYIKAAGGGGAGGAAGGEM